MTAVVLEAAIFLEVGDIDDLAPRENPVGGGSKGDGIVISSTPYSILDMRSRSWL